MNDEQFRAGGLACGLGATVPRFLNLPRLTATDALRTVTRSGSVAMSRFTPSIARWGSDEFVLRLNELLALVASLSIMGGIAVVAFVACAVLQ